MPTPASRIFDLAIDFGWFYFLTKPIFLMLQFFYGLLGNFGLAILLLTLIIKLLFFPLANKSYQAMSKMKLLQPEMAEDPRALPRRQGRASSRRSWRCTSGSAPTRWPAACRS